MTVTISKEDITNTLDRTKRLTRKADRINSIIQELVLACDDYEGEHMSFRDEVRGFIESISGTEISYSPSTYEMNNLDDNYGLSVIKGIYYNIDHYNNNMVYTRKDIMSRAKSMKGGCSEMYEKTYAINYDNVIDVVDDSNELRYPRVGTAPINVLIKRISDMKKDRFGKQPMEYSIYADAIVRGQVELVRIETKDISFYINGNKKLKAFYTSKIFEDLIQFSYKSDFRKIVMQFGHKNQYDKPFSITLWENKSEEVAALFSMVENL